MAGKGPPDLHFVTHHVMSQPPRCHVVLIDVGTYDFLSICHNSLNFDAKLVLFFGSIVVVFPLLITPCNYFVLNLFAYIKKKQ